MELEGWDPSSQPYAGLTALMPGEGGIQLAFNSFVERVLAAVGSRNLPVYRMADGEFGFLVGPRLPLNLGLVQAAVGRLRSATRSRIAKTCWGEEYTKAERAEVMPYFVGALRRVVAHGVLALYFMRRSDRWGEQYIPPMLKWFEANQIPLTHDAYVPFYFPYALLTGPRRRELLEGRRVAVLTSAGPQRFRQIREGLAGEGVADVCFVEVPPRNALLLKSLDVRTVMNCDIALVAAGIGSLRILDFLREFPGPCIDSGAALEAFVNPRVREERAFLRRSAYCGTRPA